MYQSPVDSARGSGLTGTLKLIAVVAVLGLALLAGLLVLDVIPRESFKEFSTKLLSVMAIVGLASAAIALLLRTGR
jgi:putative effector of murein hydrolase LrgA (UPF0299 family)